MLLKDALNLLGIIGDSITLKQCKNAYQRMMMKLPPRPEPRRTRNGQGVERCLGMLAAS